MDDVLPFGLVVAAVSIAGLLAVWSNRISERIRIPAPAIFLVAAAIASDVAPSLGDLPIVDVQRVVTVMLVLLLFDGGLHIGRARFRTTATPVLVVGVLGTALTAETAPVTSGGRTTPSMAVCWRKLRREIKEACCMAFIIRHADQVCPL